MKRISDIKKWERCDKMLWMSKRYSQPFMPYVYYNEDIYALAKEKLGIQEWLCGQKGDENDAFFEQEEHYEAFSKIRLTYADLRVQIPIMKKYQDGYRVYFVYSSCCPKESEAQVMADTLWVMKSLQIKVLKVNTIHLNANYVRKEQLDVNELLIVNDFLYNDKNHRGESIEKLIKNKQRDLLPILAAMEETLQKETIEKKRTNICTRRNKCPYFEYCFPYPSKDTSILNLVSCAHKFQLLDEGYKDMEELSLDQIEGTRHQFSQLMAAKTKELVFDAYAVQNFFADITYPISYLDFEWETYAFPPYQGMKPYDVLTFQYSLHMETAKGELTHKEYLGKQDCRVAFIERLLQDLPKEGSIMCFNVEGAEKLRLKDLARQFPQYEQQLRSVWERMIDLSIPFSCGLIYDYRMAGMYSLKKLVSIFTDYNYADLDISHGLEAVRNYRMMEAEDDEHQKQTLKELLEYCAMDTYAEYLIYHWILEQIQIRTIG